jgi:hypothetical protein
MHRHARYNVKVIKVTQYKSDFDALLRLNRKDRLPRGRFSEGRQLVQKKRSCLMSSGAPIAHRLLSPGEKTVA